MSARNLRRQGVRTCTPARFSVALKIIDREVDPFAIGMVCLALDCMQKPSLAKLEGKQ